MVSLGNYLRRWRKKQRYTQLQVAHLLQVDRTTYTRYELGAVDPSLDTLCRMADLLDCSTDTLLGRNTDGD